MKNPKQKNILAGLLSVVVCVLLAVPAAAQSAAVKINPNDNSLLFPSAADFYTANPPTVTWGSLTGTPTTLSGYGITDAQPLDNELTSFANILWNLGSGNLYIPIYNDPTDSFQTSIISAFGLSLIADASAAEARETLGVANPGYGVSAEVVTGTAHTIDLSNDSLFLIDLTGATGDVALTLDNPENGKTYRFRITQGATNRSLLFPVGTLSVSGGVEMTGSGAMAIDQYEVVYDGSAWAFGERETISSVEPETTTYLATLFAADGTVLSPAAILWLNDTIQGLKARALWATSRATIASPNYNVSSGNTVYAFGGLTAENFTKTGTVSWATGGFLMDGSTQEVTAADFMPGGATMTTIYYGNIFSISGDGVPFTLQPAGGSSDRSWALRRFTGSNPGIGLSISTTGVSGGDEFFNASTNTITDAAAYVAFRFDNGAVDIWGDSTQVVDATASVTSLFDTSDIIGAHFISASGTFIFYLTSTTAWSDDDIAWLRGRIETLDLN